MDVFDGVPAGFGVVKFFDEREGKKYGFISVCDDEGHTTGEEIFFHYNDGEDISDSTTPLAIPRPGDSVVFCVMSGKEGKPKACPWEYDVRPPVPQDDVEDAFDEFDEFNDEDFEENEDPLAGDVDPTGGYYEPPIHAFEAQRLEVMRQHGDYTG